MLRTLGNRVRVRGGEGEGMQMKAAFNLVVRPLSALSFVVAMLGVLAVASASALAAGDANEAACPNEGSSGFRAYLPDCRAYELVSPPFKDRVASALAGAPEAPETREATSVTAGTATLEGVLNPKAPGEAGSYELLYKHEEKVQTALGTTDVQSIVANNL